MIVALCSRPTTNVISPLLPERMSMLKCLTPFRHSHMNQVWSEEEKEDINREIVKTKASWLLERYSSSTFLPFSLLLSHILFSTDLLWISPTPPKRKTPPHLRPLRGLWRWGSSALPSFSSGIEVYPSSPFTA